MSENLPEKSERKETTETGNTNLLVGGGFAAYGTTIALTAGTICPMCVIAAPAFLGVGAYQKYKYSKAKADNSGRDRG